MSPALEEAVVFLVHNAPVQLRITQMMKLLYLADVEHARLYGQPLCDVEWTWYRYGPFSPAVYGAVEALDEQGRVQDAMVFGGQRTVLPAFPRDVAVGEDLPLRARRALTRVLERYGSLSLPALKKIAYETHTMRSAQPGERLNVRREPQRSLAPSAAGLARLLQRAPAPDLSEWGDPDASAAEDREIMRELAGLRREANNELQ